MKYDSKSDSYCVQGKQVSPDDIFKALGVKYPDRALDIIKMLEKAHSTRFKKEISPSDVHRHLLAYQSDKTLPDWFVESCLVEAT